ncbi:MAG: transposase [Proteobacteria bacterium]|nr:transposase [Pseudomonadota bacterium]
MVNYRRNLVPGGTYFFTATLRDRSSRLLTEHIGLLRAAFRTVKHKLPFRVDAIVILPEHLHAIWTLPEGDADYPGRWRAIKSTFTHSIVKTGIPVERNDKGEYALWQRRYWEHTITDEEDFRRHVDYIHFNPVKHGWVNQVADWPYSSFHRYVRQRILPRDWSRCSHEGQFGEICSPE